MNIEIREATKPEQLYTFAQSSQLCSQTGCIGYLRADFGSEGHDFWSHWEDKCSDLKTDAFKEEFDAVINELRIGNANGKLLLNRDNLADFCNRHPNAAAKASEGSAAFRIDHGEYSFLLRLNPNRGDYNVYIFVYIREWLNRHMIAAERGIRFIDPHYLPLFRIPDGGQIRITYPDGRSMIRACRYVDDYHTEVGSNLFHICEFAEHMDNSHAMIEPVGPIIPPNTRERGARADHGGEER